MAPQARLTFTPSTSVGTAHQAAPALLSSSAKHEKPLPKLPPRVNCTGPFSLLRGGGVKVGTLEVAIQRGTIVTRASPGEHGGESCGELRWEGYDQAGRAGTWSLHLIGAIEADVDAIHRALLFLPPSHALPPAQAPPSHATPLPAPHNYRNSLLLYSPTQHSIISVLPLPLPSAPHAHPSAPSPTHHPSPAAFAAYIDHLVEGISPDPTREVLERERREERRRREEAARMEEEGVEEGWEEEGEPVMGFLVLPQVTGDTAEGQVGERERKAHRKSFERLDLEMDLAPDRSHAPPPKLSPAVQRLRPTSMLSVSSFATFGSERFVTADEGESSDEDGGGTIRSVATSRADATMDSKSSGVAKGGAAPMRLRDPSRDPPHTLTNGNAVLLSFLGANSTSSSVGKSYNAAGGFSLRARQLSAQEVQQLSEQGQIEVAQVEVEQKQLAAVEQGEQDHQGWWSWLFGAVGGKQGVEAEEEQAAASLNASSWFAWFASAFIPQASSTFSGRALRRSRTARTAAGETTSRLSVFYIDEEGRGGQAFVVARGEQER